MFKSASWLKKNINNENIKILDASWYLPNSDRNNFKEYNLECVPKSVFFDIDKICDQKSLLPHMIPSQKYFEKRVSKLGISKRNIIIVYCKEGIMSSPRVWWMFRYFGHKNVFVLNGGFKAWKLSNGKTVKGRQVIIKKSNYKCNRIKKEYLIKYEELIYKIKNNSATIADARPQERFLELVPEPRKNIGSGKIQNSLNLPFNIFDINGFIKSKSLLRKIFFNKIENKKLLVCSCGSGISACTLAIALAYIGRNTWTVFDGSWTEWFIKTKN